MKVILLGIIAFVIIFSFILHFLFSLHKNSYITTVPNFTTRDNKTAQIGFSLISHDRSNFFFIGKLISVQQQKGHIFMNIALKWPTSKASNKIFELIFANSQQPLFLEKQKTTALFPASKDIKEDDVLQKNVYFKLSTLINMPIVAIASLTKNAGTIIKGTSYSCNEIILAELQQNKYFNDNCIGTLQPQIYVYEKS